jgi:hypothetical protein
VLANDLWEAHHGAEECGGAEARRVDRDRPPGPGGGDEDAAERGAEHVGRVQRETQQGVRLLDHRFRDSLRDDPLRGWEEERGHGAVQRAEHDELPDLGVAGQEERGDRSLRRHAGHVRCDHDEVPREAVGDDAAEEDERRVRDRARGEHEPELRPRAVQCIEHGERQPDRGHRAADERRRPRRVEQAEPSLAERS